MTETDLLELMKKAGFHSPRKGVDKKGTYYDYTVIFKHIHGKACLNIKIYADWTIDQILDILRNEIVELLRYTI